MNNQSKDQRFAKLEISSAEIGQDLFIPEAGEVRAGFPSPASDFVENSIDLNKYLITHPAATFFGRVKGFSMINAGISEGDLLIIDRSIEPNNGAIAVCFLDGEFTLKKIKLEADGCWLLPENEDFQPIHVTEKSEFIIWGIVIHVIKSF